MLLGLGKLVAMKSKAQAIKEKEINWTMSKFKKMCAADSMSSRESKRTTQMMEETFTNHVSTETCI